MFIGFLIYSGVLYMVGSKIQYKPTVNINYNRGGLGHTYSRLLDAEQFKNVDILFVGTSLTFRGYDTRIFSKKGITSFNLGTPAQTPLQSELLLKKYLKNINPQLVVYEINPEWIGNLGTGAALDIISNLTTFDFNTLTMVIKMKDIQIMNTFIYSFINNKVEQKLFKEPQIKNKQFYLKGGGYVESPIKFNTPQINENKILNLNKVQLHAFRRCMEFLLENDIKVILVRPPITTSLYNSFLNNKEIDAIFSKKEIYYNFNQIINLDDSLHFSDARHLNQNGVEVYNEFFIKSLKTHLLDRTDF